MSPDSVIQHSSHSIVAGRVFWYKQIMFRSKFSNLEFIRPFMSHVKAIFEVKCHVHDDWEGGVLKSFWVEIQTQNTDLLQELPKVE